MGKSKNRPPLTIEVICPECGAIHDWLPHGEQKARSPEMHRRYFLGMRLVHQSWPDTHPEQLSAEHLRQWIQMKAGYREVDCRIPLTGMDPRFAYKLLKAAFANDERLKIPVIHKGEAIVWRSKSIAFLAMGHYQFCDLNNKTDDVIKAETGLEVQPLIDEYFRMRKAIAADARGRERAPKHIGEEWLA